MLNTWRAAAVGLDAATAAFAAFNLVYFLYRLGRCREIHLLHMGNIDKERAKAEFESKFFVEVKIKD